MQIEEKSREYNNLKNNTVTSCKGEELPDRLQQSINSIIKKEGFISYEVKTKTISTDGGNYLGVLYVIDVKGKPSKGVKELNIFVKYIIPEENLKIMSVSDVYLREVYAYKNLFKIFNELQEEANVPLEERYKIIKSYDETYSEAIILENIAKKGFTTPSRMEIIPLKFAELSIQQLAVFHGLSYVMEKKRPDFYEANIKTIKQPYIFEEEFDIFYLKITNNSIKCLDDDVKEKVQKIIPTLLEKYKQYIMDNTSTGCCLVHGDFRANNTLMKQTDDEITEVITVDYQLMHYGQPILDFIYFIFCGTDQNFRKDHLEHLRDLYYESLKKFLKYFDLDIDSIYSRKVYEKMFKDKLDYGLMLSLQLLPFLLTSEEEVPDLSQDALLDIKFSLNSNFENRFKGMVDDFIQWGYIN